MTWNRLRWIAFVALCGGTVFQTTSCQTVAAQLASTLAASVISTLVNNLLAV